MLNAKEQLKRWMNQILEETDYTESSLLYLLCGKYMLSKCSEKDINRAIQQVKRLFRDVVDTREDIPARTDAAPAAPSKTFMPADDAERKSPNPHKPGSLRYEIYNLAEKLALSDTGEDAMRHSPESNIRHIIKKISGNEKSLKDMNDGELDKLKHILTQLTKDIQKKLIKKSVAVEKPTEKEVTNLAEAGFEYYHGGKDICEKCLYSIAPVLKGYDYNCPKLAKLAGQNKFDVPNFGHCNLFRWRYCKSK